VCRASELIYHPAMSGIAVLRANAGVKRGLEVKVPEKEQEINLPADQSQQIIALVDQLAWWLKDETTSREALDLFAQCRAKALEKHEADLVRWAAERAKEEAEHVKWQAEMTAKWEAEAPLRKARKAKAEEERKAREAKEEEERKAMKAKQEEECKARLLRQQKIAQKGVLGAVWTLRRFRVR
jgi:hypothetical protein